MSALSLSNGTPQVASIVTSICIACIAELKRPTDSTKRRARVKYTSGNTAQHAATLLPALTEDLARQGCGEVQISYDEEDSLTVRWPASLDDKVAVACSSWLHAHYQCHATWECPHMAATQLQRLDAACRANAYNCVPDWDDNASETLSLLLHVIGGKPGQRGASGMPYVYSLKWQPYNENNPRGRGQVEVVLTDGAGVFLVVLVKEMWLVMGGRKKGRKAAASMARGGAKRRERRKMAREAAVRTARAFEMAHVQPGAAAVVFSALCVSHAEGLEVVTKDWYTKSREVALAKALIPGLTLGPGSMEEEEGMAAMPTARSGSSGISNLKALPQAQPAKTLADLPGSVIERKKKGRRNRQRTSFQSLSTAGFILGVSATALVVYLAWQRRGSMSGWLKA